MIENILDINGNIIGTLELPDDTSPDVLQSQLAVYSWSPPVKPTIEYVMGSISNAVKFGQTIILQYAAQNVLAGITQAGQTIAVANYLQLVANYLGSGSLYAAINQINSLIADASPTKTNLSPFVTNNILYYYLNQIQSYLNIPITPNPGS